MTGAIVGVMVEVLCVLAIATKEITQNRASELTRCDRSTLSAQCSAEMFLKKLVGRRDIENALQRLENMTLEETRMTGAETLKAVRSIDNKVGGVEGILQGVTDMLQGVGDKVKNSAQSVQLAISTALIVYMVR
jgi:hypothetical protein